MTAFTAIQPLHRLGRLVALATLSLIAALAFSLAGSSVAHADSHTNSTTKDGCTITAYKPYKSNGDLHSKTTFRCNSTRGVQWAYSDLVRVVDWNADPTDARSSYGDDKVFYAGTTYTRIAIKNCGSSTRTYYTRGAMRADAWTLGTWVDSPRWTGAC